MGGDLHVVMVPWSAFGHLMPFFQLSVAVARLGVRVSFVSTPRNIERLPKVPSDLGRLMNFVEFPLPALEEGELLPDGAEATVDIPLEKTQYLKVAYDLLRQPFEKFVRSATPDWIIVDFSPYWAAEIAQELHIPILSFSVLSSSACVFFGGPEHLDGEGRKRQRSSPESLTSPPEWVTFPSSVAFRMYEAIPTQAGFWGENASMITDAQRVARVSLACEAIAVRTCPEFEGEYLNIHQKLHAKPVIPVGLLPPEEPEGANAAGGAWGEVSGWLDQQKPKSVVFVGFGSECKLTKDQVHEIGHGLELSELPFLWALRKPDWADEDEHALPCGFSERTGARGMVCFGWAPQLAILSHPSVGGSLFHGGWGSTIETLQFGHCLVLLPLIIDQPLNARFLVEKGLGVEVERGEDGSFTRHSIAKALRLAMVSKEGEKLRTRAAEVAPIFTNRQLHRGYVQRFVAFLREKSESRGHC